MTEEEITEIKQAPGMILAYAPQEAEVISHKLMLRAGMIRKVASGIYTWLPLGLKVLKKIENIVREEMDSSGAQEVFMPMVQPKELWDETKRWEKMGPELLRIKDRHERDFCLGPTHEEVITDIIRDNVKSYKELPLNIYQIQTKFRDEVRPRYGIMRGREFLMKDSYSFNIDEESLQETYLLMRDTYKKVLERIGLEYKISAADSGAIGGSASEEFHVLADSGEDKIIFSEDELFASNLELFEDKSDQEIIDQLHKKDGKKYSIKKGIEVGHIFQLGDKYSKSLSLSIQTSEGNINPLMGCYGIGISRIIAASIEQNYDEDGIIFPRSIAPFEAIIIIIGDDKNHLSEAESLQDDLTKIGIDSIIDDRNESPGKKFKDADLTGIPFQLIVSEKNQKENLLELKIRSEGTSLKENKQNILSKLKP